MSSSVIVHADAELLAEAVAARLITRLLDAQAARGSASVVLTAHDGSVLYRNDAVTFREQYQSTQDVNTFIQEGSPAISRMSRDFAQTLVSDMLNSF